MHGIDWTGQDIAGWEAGEKLDGLRVESRYSRAWSKSGGPLRLPDHLARALRLLPDCDGELYAGPGARAKLAGLGQSLRADAMWPSTTGLFIFDSSGPLPDRLPAGVFRVPNFGIVESTSAALRLASAVISAGGEGLMLRAPGLSWMPGRRTNRLLKVKVRQLALAESLAIR